MSSDSNQNNISESTNVNQDTNANPQQEEQQGGGFSFTRIIFMFILFSWISKLFNTGKGPNGSGGSNTFLFKNIMNDDTQFNIKFYINQGKKELTYSEVITNLDPVITINNVQYISEGNSSYIIENEIEYNLNTTALNYTDSTKLKKEKLFLYANIEFADKKINKKYLKIFNNFDGIFFHSFNIFKYSENLNQLIKQNSMINDYEAESMNEEKVENIQISNETDYNFLKNIYYKPEVLLYLLSVENQAELSSFEELRILKVPTKYNIDKKVFAPISCISDFWTMDSELKPLEIKDNLKIKIKIDFKFITLFYFKMLKATQNNSEMLENFNLPSTKDNFVELLKNNSTTYLVIMFTVNILHTIFSVLGFASDVSYYKNLKQLDGVYTKHLFFHLFQMFVAILYVTIEGAHFIVKIELAVGLAIEVWKLKKIFSLEFKKAFPFVGIKYKIDFKFKKSKDYETEAVNLMLKYLFIPVAIFYLGYRFYYFNHKLNTSIFKFVIEYVFFLMNLFGFILLTPQVYLNYKLKSVQHMPFKALTFKFLNTIIDDLYAFAVKTPTMYRIFCFKDDVIFIIFIYQIIKYRNNTRIAPSQEELEGEELIDEAKKEELKSDEVKTEENKKND